MRTTRSMALAQILASRLEHSTGASDEDATADQTSVRDAGSNLPAQATDAAIDQAIDLAFGTGLISDHNDTIATGKFPESNTNREGSNDIDVVTAPMAQLAVTPAMSTTVGPNNPRRSWPKIEQPATGSRAARWDGRPRGDRRRGQITQAYFGNPANLEWFFSGYCTNDTNRSSSSASNAFESQSLSADANGQQGPQTSDTNPVNDQEPTAFASNYGSKASPTTCAQSSGGDVIEAHSPATQKKRMLEEMETGNSKA